jgi:glycosyltransferase involved in cell wall biosynthesis
MVTNTGNSPRYSIVVPVYNEEAVLPVLLRRLDLLMQQLNGLAETIFVDDGSTDCSAIILQMKAKDDSRFRYVGLSRNFGHQIAITAGMDAAAGDAVIVMDADLQDPPEVVGEMVARWQDGYDVVYGRRLSRDGEGRIKQWTASLFYRLLRRLASIDIPGDAGDFRLVDRKVVDAFRGLPEQDRFVRGMFAWLGFRHTEVAFHRLPRAAGETKYPLRKMMRLAMNGVIGFSDAPLRLAIWGGFAVSAFAVLYAISVIIQRLTDDPSLVVGWASTIIVVSLLSGINMILTGIMGLYLGRIHAEVKRRPLYVISKEVGFDRPRAGRANAETHAVPRTNLTA